MLVGRPSRVLGVALLVVAVLLGLAAPADAGETRAGRRGIAVVQLEGLVDPPNAALLREAIADANDRRLTALVVQIDSGGAVDADVRGVVRAIARSAVPIVAWVGPSGAGAKGAATLVAQAAHLVYVSQGSSIGPARPVSLDDPGDPSRREVAATLAALAEARGRRPEGARRLTSGRLSPTQARRVGAIDGVRPTVGEVVVNLDGVRVRTATGERELSTARVVGTGRDRRRQPNQEVVFHGLGLGAQLQHTLISPWVAYALFVVGLCLIVFEFFTASIGLAGAVGALAVVAACYGFSHLPMRWWAVGLLLLAVFGLAIDVQAGGLGAWTMIGTVALVAGTLTLYGGSPRLDVPWWAILVVVGGVLLFMLGGMTAMIRSRFSTPTIGREGMIGEMGSAEVAVDPDGVVVVRGARWRARTNRATPIGAGEAVRVVAVEGLVLEVEPESGGARDYRERRR